MYFKSIVVIKLKYIGLFLSKGVILLICFIFNLKEKLIFY